MRGKRERGQKVKGKEERKEGDTCKTTRSESEEQRDRKVHIYSGTHPTALQWSSA